MTVTPIILDTCHDRVDILNYVTNKNGVGIELGVAEGSFSEKILTATQSTDFYLYSVDMWAGDRGHDVEQYKSAVKRLDPWKRRNSILKMMFEQALDLFPDNHFDFIYVDGYAHTGEADGQHFHDWWPKVKKGGVIGGDDYHEDWPRVIPAVNQFAEHIKRRLYIIPNDVKSDMWGMYPTWFCIK